MCISMTYLQLNVLALKLELCSSQVTSLTTFCLHLQDNGVNLLVIRAVEPDKYALSLMDVLFTEVEMATCCYDNKKSSKPGLPPSKVQLLEGYALKLNLFWVSQCLLLISRGLEHV